MAKRAEPIASGVYTRADGATRAVSLVIEDGCTVVQYSDAIGHNTTTIPSFRASQRLPADLSR